MNSVYALILLFGALVACSPQDDAETDDGGEVAGTESAAASTPVSMVSPHAGLDERASNYRRPYGSRAPWNIPVGGLRRHPQSDEFVELLWRSTVPRPGNFNLSFEEYTYPVYSVSEATSVYTVQTRWPSNLDGNKIPWNPAWRPAPGSDAQVIVIDESNGREWNLFQVTTQGNTVIATNGNLVPGDYRTRSLGFAPSRGIGIQYLAMLVRPEEIAAGRIEHALSMPAKGTSGEYSVPPALKIEHRTGRPGIPEGLRYAIDVTDAEIEAWVNGLHGASPETQRAARIIAVALRDYGWFITDSAGSSHFQFEANISAGSDWAALGLSRRGGGDYVLPRDLLDGLVTRDRIYAIVPSNEY
ncbi:hypothetical protein [Sinisalibacter aestuarii]|uniref:DUF1254 domain-containing protein n=1 Tax=Sinisalibacter aestuarii TaxID=2949426 RepID=A0ABQ5LUZ5_9RHOB|nr:hypothetical protein [Sinisalibacter aestuarii]GKY88146.1 hypothetical protein STA1M1_20150 [Sinisalibacter aestuarii]